MSGCSTCGIFLDDSEAAVLLALCLVLLQGQCQMRVGRFWKNTGLFHFLLSLSLSWTKMSVNRERAVDIR